MGRLSSHRARPEEAEAVFAGVGLSGGFWRLR
jgi:hypothetical protein